ncbi:MAG: AMP-binding protein, partial [Dehalococcoidia bacterium]
MVMQHPIIAKDPGKAKVKPNLADYDATRASFKWEDIEKELDWLPNGGLNLAHEAIDRHCLHGNGGKNAMIWEGKNGEEETYSYDDLRRMTNKFSNVLETLGVKKGQRVFTFMERLPEIYFTVFGTLKAGCIIGPLFSAFG